MRPRKKSQDALAKRGRFDSWWHDLAKLVRRDEAQDEWQAAQQFDAGAWPPNMMSRYLPVPAEQQQQLAEADARAAVKVAGLQDSVDELGAVWRAAIDALPRSRRTLLDHLLAELTDAERQLVEAQALLASLGSGGGDVWARQKATHQGIVTQLQGLVLERRADFRRECSSVRHALDQVLRAREAEAAQMLASAAKHYREAAQRARVALGRLRKEQRLIGAVRAQVRDAATVEEHVGRRVSPVVDRRALRDAERREERRLGDLLLRGGRVL